MATTSTFKPETLEVPGASVYYEVRGSGPVLLLMPGGPADATTFRQMENDLASRYTVVTYDRRGLSHSKVTEPIDDSRMVQIVADAVHRLLAKVTDAKAWLLVSRCGDLVALVLVGRHAE